MDIKATLLENPFVRLEPLADRHRDGLRAAVDADADFFRQLYPYSWAGEHFEPRWAWLGKQVEQGAMIAFAVVVDGECRGISTYYAIEPANAAVAIGGTYYAPDLRGGAVNPSCKRLMMAHAFDSGARRVVYHVDALNLRSRAAVTKLGAVQEGIMRQDRVTWTGRIRDTVVFSILADEWPAVREKLDQRIAGFPSPA